MAKVITAAASMLVLVVALGTARAEAQTPPAVSIVGSRGAIVYVDCDGAFNTSTVGLVSVQRTSTDAALTVSYTVTGPVTPFPSGGTVTFDPGATQALITFTPDGSSRPTFDLTLSPGADYTLGEPSQVHVEGEIVTPNDCTQAPVTEPATTPTDPVVSADTLPRTGMKAVKAESTVALVLIFAGLGLLGLALGARRTAR